MSSFAPIPGGQTPSKNAQSVGGVEVPNEPQETIIPVDLNDPLLSEPLDVDVEKDAYAQPVPLPDGKWRAKLKLEGIKQDNGENLDWVGTRTKTAPILPYLQTSVSATIIDVSGKFDGIKVFPDFGGRVSTLLRKDRSSQVSTLLSKLRKPDGTSWVQPGMRLGQVEWMELLKRALSGEPEVGIESQWAVTCTKCSEEMKNSDKYPTTTRGMHRFPQNADKNKRAAGEIYDPELKCAANASHGYTRAYPKIVRFLSLDELKTAK